MIAVAVVVAALAAKAKVQTHTLYLDGHVHGEFSGGRRPSSVVQSSINKLQTKVRIQTSQSLFIYFSYDLDPVETVFTHPDRLLF